MAEQKRLEIRAAELDAAELAHYARILRHDTSGGLQSVGDMLRGARGFAILHEGATVARYAIRCETWAKGSEAVIVGAVGNLPGHDLTAQFVPVIERQCAELDAVTVLTKRKHLVGKLLAMGYELDAFTLRKRLK